jgi:hypothetical protein
MISLWVLVSNAEVLIGQSSFAYDLLLFASASAGPVLPVPVFYPTRLLNTCEEEAKTKQL